MVSNDKNQITLRITCPDGRTHESVSELESIILGSGAGAGIQIPDPKVSNLHAMLKVEKNGVVKVIDLGSEGGTHIGERPVEGPTQLNPGDVIRVGASRVEVFFGTARGTVNPGSLGETSVLTPRVTAATHGVPPRMTARGNTGAHVAVTQAPSAPANHAPTAPVNHAPTAPVNHAPTAPVSHAPVARAPTAHAATQAPTPVNHAPTAHASVSHGAVPATPAQPPVTAVAHAGVPPTTTGAMPTSAVRNGAPVAQVRSAGRSGNAAMALKPELTPETLPIHAPATGESAPKPGKRVLQVAQVWGDTVVGLQHYGDGVSVSVGESKKSDFNVFAPEVGDRFTLAEARGDKAVVHVPRGAQVTLFSGTRRVGPDQLRAEGRLLSGKAGEEIHIGLDERVKVSLDTVCFLVRFVAPSPSLGIKKLEKDDFTFFGLAALLLLAFLGLVVAMMKTPKLERGTFADNDANTAALVKLLIKPAKPVVVPKPSTKKEEKSSAEEGAKAKDEEGAFGKPDAKQAEADPSKKGSPVVDPNKKEKDRKKVMQSGLLAALKGTGAGASDVFGPGGLGSGINDKLGGLKGGAGLTDRQGVGGLGSRGNGTGGGGAGLGLGGLGTKGNGHGGPGGTGGIDLGGRGHDTTRIIPGKTVVVGGLSKEVIAKVIRDHQREIKYCYESELNKVPDLAGKVAVQFVIGPDGAVQDAAVSETSLNNSNAENCMLTRIKRWKFPEPQGGGVVSVNFPWIFKPAGND